MDEFRLPVTTHINHVNLQVPDLEEALAFYEETLGFRRLSGGHEGLSLSANGRPPGLITLTPLPDAQRKSVRAPGLYHVAIRLPNHGALARIFRHLVERETRFHGFADHLVSEALYLPDPFDNGIELYADRPKTAWSWQSGQVAMATDPLDLEALLRDGLADHDPWAGIDPATDIGHIHLQVSGLGRAEAFYHGLLGFDITQRNYPGALFLSAGGYHHHIGVNIWNSAGAPPPSPDAVGLRAFGIAVPEGEAWRALISRLEDQGIAVEKQDAAAFVRDPDQNLIELTTG